ncbi:MAG: sporulation protein YqfD [Clostridia bacterium]|nr:sporulation protein YqfD [Clostridia bacterium]
MPLKETVKNIKGYVCIKVEGYFVERFLNLMMNSGIDIWDIRQENVGVITAKIYAREFSKIKSISRKSKCKVRIENKKGVPFVLNKYRHRKIFAALIAIISTVITVLNLFVWKVEVIGDFTIPIEEIRSDLEEENIKVGVLKKNINSETAKINMTLKRNDIAWIGVSIKGNKAIVEIIEKVKDGKDYVNTYPGNVISDKEGIVEKIYVAQGTALVRKGEIVEKGQILISGEMKSDFSETRLVPADGEVTLKTWYTEKYKVPYEKEIISKTGNKDRDVTLKLFNCKINLLNNGTNFEKYDTIISCNRFSIFGRIDFPIEITTRQYEEISIEKLTYTKLQAKQLAIKLAKESAMRKVPKDAKIVDEKVNLIENKDGIEAEILIQCEEKTGIYKRIGG